MQIMTDSPIRFPGLFGDWAFTASSKALDIGNGIYWYGILIALGLVIAIWWCMNQKSKYGITEELLVPQQESTFTTGEDSDVSYIQQKGTLVVGITEFAPMDYKDENGQWIGFDADLAKLVAERLGVEIQFVVIDWGQKINELDSKAIDVVWNGMTLTDGVMSAMACTNAYCKNAQVVVVRGQ
jgi:ABC-type amino acid transport substrate-binding protein